MMLRLSLVIATIGMLINEKNWASRSIRKTYSNVLVLLGLLHNLFFDLAHNRMADRWKRLLSLVEHMKKTHNDDYDLGMEILNRRLLGNIIVLTRIRSLLSHTDEAMQEDPGSLPTLQEAERYMKFATAVYGPEMVVAARVANTNDRSHTLSRLSSIEDIVLSHLDGIELGNILDRDLSAGDSRDYLRYMVVVDPKKKAVVLAIRGTLALSSLGTTYSFFPEEFCGGMAHGGFAKIARAVWARAEASIRAKLQQLAPQAYSLVITGHSAGASVASLITIMLCHEKPLPPCVRVQCMAYGPLPCFSPLDAAADAVQNTTAYVHNHDLVTCVSVLSIRFFIRCIADIDIEIKRMPIHERMALYSGRCSPAAKLVRAIDVARRKSLPTCDGQPLLLIPAKCTVRLGNKGHDANGASYSTTFLDPLKYPCRILSLFDAIDTRVLNDHSPISYEGAFQALTARQAPAEQMETKLCHASSLLVEAAEQSKTTRAWDDDNTSSNGNVPPLLSRASVYGFFSDEESSLSDDNVRADASAYSFSSDEDSSLAN